MKKIPLSLTPSITHKNRSLRKIMSKESIPMRNPSSPELQIDLKVNNRESKNSKNSLGILFGSQKISKKKIHFKSKSLSDFRLGSKLDENKKLKMYFVGVNEKNISKAKYGFLVKRPSS